MDTYSTTIIYTDEDFGDVGVSETEMENIFDIAEAAMQNDDRIVVQFVNNQIKISVDPGNDDDGYDDRREALRETASSMMLAITEGRLGQWTDAHALALAVRKTGAVSNGDGTYSGDGFDMVGQDDLTYLGRRIRVADMTKIDEINEYLHKRSRAHSG